MPIAAVELLLNHACDVVHTLGNAVTVQGGSGADGNRSAVVPHDVEILIKETTSRAFELIKEAGNVLMH